MVRLLESFGSALELKESLLDVSATVGGSSPAYVYMFIEAMADSGVAEGLPRAQAYEISAQAVLGAAKMVLESGKHPGDLKTRLPPLPAPQLKEFRFLMSVVSAAPLSQLFELLSQKLARCKKPIASGDSKARSIWTVYTDVCVNDLRERSACKIDEAYKLILSLPEVFYLSWIRK